MEVTLLRMEQISSAAQTQYVSPAHASAMPVHASTQNLISAAIKAFNLKAFVWTEVPPLQLETHFPGQGQETQQTVMYDCAGSEVTQAKRMRSPTCQPGNLGCFCTQP